MNKSNTIGIIIVTASILALFFYIDFFADNKIASLHNASTSTLENNNYSTSTIEYFPAGTFVLKLNEERKILDTTITPWAVLEDSRCPTDVQCIQAGKVVVAVRINSPTRNLNTEMKIDDEIIWSGFILTLKNVTPYKTSGIKIKDNEYRFIFSEVPVGKTYINETLGKCYVGGCSGQICSDEPDAVSTCEYKPEYSCYAKTKCERQASGKCDWTQTTELQRCIVNANSKVQ